MLLRALLLVISPLLALAAPSAAPAPAPLAPESGVPQNLTARAIDARYVFTAFTQNSESNLYVYTSADATTFSLLAGPTYTPPTGLIRDPSVIYHTE